MNLTRILARVRYVRFISFSYITTVNTKQKTIMPPKDYQDCITGIQALRDKAWETYLQSTSDWIRDRAYGEWAAYCRVLALMNVEPLPEGLS